MRTRDHYVCPHCGRDIHEDGLALTHTQARIFMYLLSQNEPVSPEKLTMYISGRTTKPCQTQIRAHVATLRRKLMRTKWVLSQAPYEILKKRTKSEIVPLDGPISKTVSLGT